MTEEQIELKSEEYVSVRYMQYSLYEKYAKKFGLGYKSLFVLRMLYTLPEGCTQNDICRSSVITKQPRKVCQLPSVQTSSLVTQGQHPLMVWCWGEGRRGMKLSHHQYGNGGHF